MERTEAIQVLTLWFVVLIFLTTESAADNAFVTVVGLVAVVLLHALPVYLLFGVYESLVA